MENWQWSRIMQIVMNILDAEFEYSAAEKSYELDPVSHANKVLEYHLQTIKGEEDGLRIAQNNYMTMKERSLDAVVLLDCLGTIQGYEGAEPGKHKEFYLQKVAEAHGMEVEEMLENVPNETYLQWTAEMIRDSKLVPKVLPGADKLISTLKKYKFRPVIVTADIPEGAELTSRPFVESGLINLEDVYGINELGSKKDPETWVKVHELYIPNSKVISVFEDTAKNLQAALNAFRIKGYLVREERNQEIYPLTFDQMDCPKL